MLYGRTVLTAVCYHFECVIVITFDCPFLLRLTFKVWFSYVWGQQYTPELMKYAHNFVLPWLLHYNDVIMGAKASQITSLTIIYSTAQIKENIKALRYWPLCGNSLVTGEFPHKWSVMRKMFPFDDVIMSGWQWINPLCVPMFLRLLSWNCGNYRSNLTHGKSQQNVTLCFDDNDEINMGIISYYVLLIVDHKLGQ